LGQLPRLGTSSLSPYVAPFFVYHVRPFFVLNDSPLSCSSYSFTFGVLCGGHLSKQLVVSSGRRDAVESAWQKAGDATAKELESEYWAKLKNGKEVGSVREELRARVEEMEGKVWFMGGEGEALVQ
jgi:hypothetical protein